MGMKNSKDDGALRNALSCSLKRRRSMKQSKITLIVASVITMSVVACADGSNIERSTARSLENAGSVYRTYEPKVIGPGESPNPNTKPTPNPEND